MKIWLLLAVFGVTYAARHTCTAPASQTVTNGPSGTNDDDSTSAVCPSGTTLTACKCASAVSGNDDCDGSLIRHDNSGTSCIARNMHGGSGVNVVATCQAVQLLCETPAEAAPIISCPADYALSGCQFKMEGRENAAAPKPTVQYNSPNAGDCSVANEANCGGKCQVQAMCLKQDNY